MRRNSLFLALPLLVFPGCVFDSVTKLEPEAEHIELVNEVDRPSNCKVLGKITGSSRAGDEKKARKGAENEFRNQALELKANYAMIESDRGGHVGTTTQQEVVLNGKALYCTTLEMEAKEEEAKEKARVEKEEKERKAQEEKERKEQEAKEKHEQEERDREAKDKEREAKDKEKAAERDKNR
jgi:hypothetical protein